MLSLYCSEVVTTTYLHEIPIAVDKAQIRFCQYVLKGLGNREESKRNIQKF